MEEMSTDKVASCQKSLPSTQDPGWNDPPKWAYSAKSNSSNTPVKRLLNKRVAFPINSNVASSNANSDLPSTDSLNPLPPIECTTKLTTMPHAPMTAPTSKEQSLEDMKLDMEESLKDCIDNFEFLINKHVTDKNRADELRKRLEIMKSMWKDNKFNVSICSKICIISQALLNNDASSADKMHINLMMDHASLCSSWIPYIRQLIQKVKEKNTPMTEESLNSSYLIPNSS